MAITDAVKDPAAPTPIERRGAVWVKRDDLFEVAGARGGKARTAWALAQGAPGLVTAGSRHSPQVNIVAHIAAALGIPCRVHVPSGPLSPEVEQARELGAEVVQHHPGYNTVIVKRARDDAAARGWREIPFGMECQEAVRQTAAQVVGLPAEARRIVVPLGSGMSLAGILTGLEQQGDHRPVLAVQVGADPIRRLDRYAPVFWFLNVEIVRSALPYEAHPAETCLDGLRLDPVYEAKCLEYLQPDDLLWVVGIRPTAALANRDAVSRAPGSEFVYEQAGIRVNACGDSE